MQLIDRYNLSLILQRLDLSLSVHSLQSCENLDIANNTNRALLFIASFIASPSSEKIKSSAIKTLSPKPSLQGISIKK